MRLKMKSDSPLRRIRAVGLSILFLVLSSGCTKESSSAKYMVISDNTMGSGRFGDPEDGFALLTAMLNEGARPNAIISTFGNTDETTAYDSILKVRAAAGSGVRVLRGAAAPADRVPDHRIEGVEHLVAEAARSKGHVDVVSIGSLTTLASAVEHDSAFAENVGRIVIMGGAVFVPGNVPLDFKAEFNLAFDAESARTVFEHLSDKLTLVPLDATNGVVFNSEDIERLRVGTRPLHHFILESVSRWYELNAPIFGGFYLFDAAALVAYLAPEVVTREETVRLRVDPSGATIVDESGWPVSVVLGIDGGIVKRTVFGAVGL